MEYRDFLYREYKIELSDIDINYYADLLYTPNDLFRSSQWYIEKIKADKAWEISLGASSVIVAVIDYGFHWQHEDLGKDVDGYENVWLNERDIWNNSEIPSSGDKIDNDGNGFVDDFKGWDFINGSNDVRKSIDHGTMVAGIIGAKTNNLKGIAGIAGGKTQKEYK